MKHFLIILIIFLTHEVFCQEIYLKSSIVTLQNDTIKGFISNIYDSKTIKFKKKKNDKPTIYTPRLLRGFILDDNVFESRKINVPFYKYQTFVATESAQRLGKDLEKGRYVDTIFIQKLMKGVVSLYKGITVGGFTYYFAEKNGIFKELPPQYCEVRIDSNAMRSTSNRQWAELDYARSSYTKIFIKDDYLDTLGYFFQDKRYVTLPSRNFQYTEKKLSEYVEQYNKRNGIPNGGVLKSKIRRKIFTGISAGTLALQYDDIIQDRKVNTAIALKLYGIYPLSGVNRNVFAKFGFNYVTYSNDFYKKSIPSVSFGLRYAAIVGLIRPYIDGSVGLSSMNVNNRPTDFGFPLTAEAGVNIPIKNYFLTLGVSNSPLVVYRLNGYKFWTFNVGFMF